MIRFIRSSSPEAEQATGFRKSARAKKVIEGLLPPPIRIGGKAKAYIVDELEAVNAARAVGADDETIRKLVKALVAARSAMKAA